MKTDSEINQAIEVLAIEDKVRKQPALFSKWPENTAKPALFSEWPETTAKQALFSEHPENTAKPAPFSERPENNANLHTHTNAMISSNRNTSNKKRRLLNKRCMCTGSSQQCHVQTPLSRKLRQVDITSTNDLVTEISALIKNPTGLPSKLHRVLIDTGCSKTLVKAQHVPVNLEVSKKTKKIEWKTNGGIFNTKYEVLLTLILPEFSSSLEIQWACAIDENPESTYGMIIGRDLQSTLRWTSCSVPVPSRGTESPFPCGLGNRSPRKS